MNKRKYPVKLFIFGFITNVIFHYFFLFVPSLILLIIGIFNQYCLIIRLIILLIDLIISFIYQLIIRNTFLKDSDNPDFQDLQDAVSKEGDWAENVRNLVNEIIEKQLNEEKDETDK